MRFLLPLTGVFGVALLTACGPTVNSEVSMKVPDDAGRISLLFQDFEAGTVCTVATPQGTLSAELMPGKIEYPDTYRAAPVTCDHPSGSRYTINVNDILPASFRVAGLTARPDGSLIATISTGDALLNASSESAVTKVR